MLLRTYFLVIGFCAVDGIVAAQEEPPIKEISELGNSAKLSDEVVDLKAIAAQLANAVEDLTHLTRAHEMKLTDQDERIAIVEDVTNEHSTQIGALKDTIDKLQVQLNEQFTRQQQILEEISNVDSLGQRIPRISAVMEDSPDFKSEMEQVVNKSIHADGSFKIVNKMPTDQTVSVNRQDYSVQSGATLTLKVPVGTVTTQLTGNGQLNWTIGAPNYEQSVEIVPNRSAYYVSRPIDLTTTYYTTQPFETTTYPISPSYVYFPYTTYYYPSATAYWYPFY